MKRIKVYSIILLLLSILLTGCSKENLAEKGINLLDKMFGSTSAKQSVSSERPPSPPSSSDSSPDGPSPEEPVSPASGNPVPADQAPISSELSSAEPEPPEPVSSQPVSTESITPSHTDATFFGPGESFMFQPVGVTGIYACTYSSDDESIASVDSKTGKVTAVGPGTTKIKMHVESNGQYDFDCIVRCSWEGEDKVPTLPVEDQTPSHPAASNSPSSTAAENGTSGISASHTDATFFNPKEHFQFLPKGAGSDFSCTYTTDNAEVASVDDKGVVTAVGPGTTTVTMTLDAGGTEYIFKCIVRCNWS